MKKSFANLTVLVFYLGLTCFQALAATEFLHPDQAFVTTAKWSAKRQGIELSIAPVKGYYLYKDSLHFYLGHTASDLALLQPDLPTGIQKFDPIFQKTKHIYDQAFTVLLPTGPFTGQTVALKIVMQGCAESGICYSPISRSYSLRAAHSP